MTLKNSLTIVVVTLALGLASFGLVLFRLNPYSAPQLSIPMFYVSFFFFVSSIATLIGFFARMITRKKDEEFYNPLNVSLRQGVLLGLCTGGLLAFQSMRTLTMWDGILLVAIIVLIEVYFMARERISQ
jgi:peptidoglycan/LPS O-acetylase OafA/YrhL